MKKKIILLICGVLIFLSLGSTYAFIPIIHQDSNLPIELVLSSKIKVEETNVSIHELFSEYIFIDQAYLTERVFLSGDGNYSDYDKIFVYRGYKDGCILLTRITSRNDWYIIREGEFKTKEGIYFFHVDKYQMLRVFKKI